MDNTKQLAQVNQLAEVPITTELVSSPDFAKKYEYLVALTNYLGDLKKNIDNEIKDLAKSQYLETGENSITNNGFKYTYVPESTRETFNSKQFKVDHADLYKEYVRVSNVSDSLKTFRVKTEDSNDIIEG